tara:strand:- start:3008 stop:3532 length:525 start_codon:yes stop_codon:yes gene_type:complete
MGSTTNIATENIINAILAPFGGKDTHDENGEPKPSTSGRSWTFTLHNTDRKTHLTFKSRRPKGWTVDSPVLIDLMVGSDNTNDFGFIGSINKNGFFKESPKAKVAKDRLEVASRSLVWLLTKLRNETEFPEAFEFKGSTGCCRCGRKLTHPDSIDDGMGPICRAKANKSQVSKG